ncbi:enolase C-terminal domain-like protein [Gilvimarinus agarilyticus]|uniref:enolase C-terminal domain-like protein n=1 Tax=Gilvimarinus agarilyticus TaxID=679259 RepID=UPI0005A049E8|nr:enolase C-terminal domain-like protein [Gilvimarinus agarilyticus]
MITVQSVRVTPVAAPPTGFGGDARNIAQGGPTYANVYLQITTSDHQLNGSSIIFTNGHGLKEMCQLTEQFATRFLLGGDSPIRVDTLHEGTNFGRLCQMMLQDSDYGWLGAVGMSRMAIGAIINGLWDLLAKQQQKPGWHVLAQMQPEQLIACIDFEHISDVLAPADALALLKHAQQGLPQRIDRVYQRGLLAYNTAGWSGISIEQLQAQTRLMIERRWPQIKIKVGASFAHSRAQLTEQGKAASRHQLDQLAKAAADDDLTRLRAVFETIEQHDHRHHPLQIAVDSNQVFDIRSATVYIGHLAKELYRLNPAYKIVWFEEPTTPHSAMAHLAIQHSLQLSFTDYEPPLSVPLSTGEQGASPVVFKDSLFANLGRFEHELTCAIDVIQMDYSRVAGIADNLAILLLAQQARSQGRDVRICPHTGGIGLCEGMRNVQALQHALFGHTNNKGTPDILEFVEEPDRSVHEGVFSNPAVVVDGYYQMDSSPGVGVDYTEAGLARYRLPDGSAWTDSDECRTLAKRLCGNA